MCCLIEVLVNARVAMDYHQIELQPSTEQTGMKEWLGNRNNENPQCEWVSWGQLTIKKEIINKVYVEWENKRMNEWMESTNRAYKRLGKIKKSTIENENQNPNQKSRESGEFRIRIRACGGMIFGISFLGLGVVQLDRPADQLRERISSDRVRRSKGSRGR